MNNICENIYNGQKLYKSSSNCLIEKIYSFFISKNNIIKLNENT